MDKRAKFHGSMPALITPFKDGKFDEPAFRALIDWQIAVRLAWSGAGRHHRREPDAEHEEHRRVVDICIDEARGRVPVIAGAGSNNTAEAIELARHAENAGADAVLVVTPYYNKPTQEGLYQHFKAINDAIGIPIIIYNIPPRSVIDMSRRYDEAAVRVEEHRRREGRHRRRRPHLAPTSRDGAGLYPALGRRYDRARAAWPRAPTAASRLPPMSRPNSAQN